MAACVDDFQLRPLGVLGQFPIYTLTIVAS